MIGSVLFACSENALRSPMAEAIAKHHFGSRLYVDSVGVREGEIDPFVVEVLSEIGIDASRHVAKRMDDLLDTSFDLIVSLSPEAHHRSIELTRTSAAEVEYWNTVDPSLVDGNRETRLDAYRGLRDWLTRRIRERLARDDEPPP
ncbi:MAG: low molecular weight phosphatase family protein [Defluviicoccus sp.]|nr:low molecular weight phosphatase family protein [Defluviicoccus sp.]MDE0382985.1 low molecular weight phosphatase family protein [Defluviicoccus sp.]